MKIYLIFAQLVRLIISWVSFVFNLFVNPKIILYTTDVVSFKKSFDSRMEILYLFMKKNRVSYFEIVHVRAGWGFLNNFFRRMRPVFYLESIDTLAKILKLGNATEEDIYKFRERIVGLIVRKLKPKFIWSIDDPRGHQDIMLLESKKLGIPTYLFQHGRFNKYSPVADKVIPTGFVVWNEYWKNILLSISKKIADNKEVILIGGRIPPKMNLVSNEFLSSEIKNILILYEPKSNPEEVKEYVVRLLEYKKFKIFIKFRGDINLDIQVSDSLLREMIQNKKINVVTNIEDIIKDVDLVLGSYSTMLYEMVGIGKRVGVLDISSMQAEDLIDDGMAILIRKENIQGDIDMAMSIFSERVLLENAKKLNITVDINDTLNRIYNS